MKTLLIATLLAVLTVLPKSALADAEADIRTLLSEQQQAWNRGDIPAFMNGYWNNEKLRFASGNSITYGWQPTLDRYLSRYHNRSLMGQLQFEVLSVRQLSPTYAIAFGRWALTREDDKPKGLFTLTLEKFPEGWRIIADHTSSE